MQNGSVWASAHPYRELAEHHLLALRNLPPLVALVMLGLFYVLNNLADLPLKASPSLYANLSPKAKIRSSAKDVPTFLKPAR